MILIQGDTLRKDHLDLYGYERATAPTLARLAEEGAFFDNAITQTSWTKAATPSIMTSLYPSTHGVHQIPDRLPASATTIAEVFRDAGTRPLSFSSVAFTGQFTNLHQGFEELHESEIDGGARRARAAPRRRASTWTASSSGSTTTATCRSSSTCTSSIRTPPYEPNRPYDTMWADPQGPRGVPAPAGGPQEGR